MVDVMGWTLDSRFYAEPVSDRAIRKATLFWGDCDAGKKIKWDIIELEMLSMVRASI